MATSAGGWEQGPREGIREKAAREKAACEKAACEKVTCGKVTCGKVTCGKVTCGKVSVNPRNMLEKSDRPRSTVDASQPPQHRTKITLSVRGRLRGKETTVLTLP